MLGHEYLTAPHQPPNKLLLHPLPVLCNRCPKLLLFSTVSESWAGFYSQGLHKPCLVTVSQIKVRQAYLWDSGKFEFLLWFFRFLSALLLIPFPVGNIQSRECLQPPCCSPKAGKSVIPRKWLLPVPVLSPDRVEGQGLGPAPGLVKPDGHTEPAECW